MKPIRLYYAISKYGPRLAATLLVLGGVGMFGAGWVYSNPPTTEVTDQTDQKTVESELLTRAAVTGETNLYRHGAALEDQPVYLESAVPNVTLLLQTRLPSASGGDVDQRVELVYTATRDGETFWKRTESLRGRTTREGRTVATHTDFAATDALTREKRYQAEFGDAADVSLGIRVTVDYALDGYEGTLTETYAIASGSGWYSVPSGTASRTHGTPVTRTVELPARRTTSVLASSVGGAVLFGAGLAVAVIYLRRFRNSSAAEFEPEIHRQRYEDWISRGTVPEDRTATAIEMDSLEELVDVAIDTGERVIHDEAHGNYVVLRHPVVYRYAPPAGEGPSASTTERGRADE